jgi:DNA-binding beta-propeller fold protein YncE
VVAAKGLIFVTGTTSPGGLYQIDPSQPAGAVTTLTTSLGGSPLGITFDGERIWTANARGSISIVNLNPLSVTTVTAGFDRLAGILYDGTNIWVTDFATVPGKLFKLDSNGAIIQTVTVGELPLFPVFDGTNIWVPNGNAIGAGDSITVVRASTGAVVATLFGNGLRSPLAAAFDGERILVTNQNLNSVSLWKAADLSPLGTVFTGSATPYGVCSDGLNFWITLSSGHLARF